MVVSAVGKVKKITSLIRKSIDNSDTFKNNPDLTNVTGWTIGFVSRRNAKGLETYQKDVENEFKISRSTATGLLQSMESHGYIYREVSSIDNRLKRIVLTEKARLLHNKVIETFDKLEYKMLEGFNNKEKEELFAYLLRIEDNLENNKEEEKQ